MEIKEKDEKDSHDSDNMIPFSMKLDKDIFDRIKEMAKTELRSVNKQITYLLICGLKYKETENSGG